jgi:hypothetical protein
VGGWGPMLVNNRLICPSVSELRMPRKKKKKKKETERKEEKMSNVKYQESVCVMVHKLMHKLL